MKAHHDANRRPGDLDAERLALVASTIVNSGARSVLDLGCGVGKLLARLRKEPQIERLVGLEVCVEALAHARTRLNIGMDVRSAVQQTQGVSLHEASLLLPDERLAGFDAAALVEVIEHLDPGQLPAVERSVFRCFRPGMVVVTTPNQEYNRLYPMGRRRFRDPDHRFEWPRHRFQEWAGGMAQRNGYRVSFRGIGAEHPSLGASTQMAVFAR
ncbi:methyltransferase domain-containing protein [Aquibaculum sediminis]|uniref:methyltransferase domain-containing protein n=1 Tax=Aquibaculum sediminis TaxID=3231907 RepID=UPI0034541E98